jgi:hypothetical protein
MPTTPGVVPEKLPPGRGDSGVTHELTTSGLHVYRLHTTAS